MKYLVFFGKSEAFDIQAFDFNGYASDFDSNFPDFELLESRFLTTDSAENTEMLGKYVFNKNGKTWTLLKYYGYAQAHTSSRVEGSTIGVGIMGDCDIKISHFNFQLLEVLYEAFCNISLDRKKFKAVNFKDDSIRVFNAFAKKYSTESFQFSEAKSGVGGSVDYIVVKSFSDLDLLTNTNGLGSRVYFSVDAKHVERYYNQYSDGARLFAMEGSKLIDIVKRKREIREAEQKKAREQEQREEEARRKRDQEQRDADAKRIRDQEALQQRNQAMNPQKKSLSTNDQAEIHNLNNKLNSKAKQISKFKKYLAVSVCFGFILFGVCIYLMITAPEEKKGAQPPSQGGDVPVAKVDNVADSVKNELEYLNKLALAPDKIELLNPWLRSIYELSMKSEIISKADTTDKNKLKTLQSQYNVIKIKFEANSKLVLDCLKIKIDTAYLNQNYILKK
jgi:hypothetical protein